MREEAEETLTQRLRESGGNLTAASKAEQDLLSQALTLEHAAAKKVT
jgi:hypothetical protein